MEKPKPLTLKRVSFRLNRSLDCSWVKKKMLTETNTITRKPKDKITVILLHRMSNGTLIQMSSHEKNIATTIEKSIYERVAKRVKQIPPLNRNIRSCRHLEISHNSWGMWVSWCDCRLISIPGFPSPLPPIETRQPGFQVGNFFGKPKWQVSGVKFG